MLKTEENKKLLNYKNLKMSNSLPIKIVQFGEGNFLRAFVGYAFHELNKNANFEGGIAVVQPIENGLVDLLNQQDGLYTLFINGLKEGKPYQEMKLINNIVKGINPYQHYDEYLDLAKEEALKFVISNTTEAGITYYAQDKFEMTPPSSFPAKLAVLLYKRFMHFKGDHSKGLIIIPCELINHNSDALKRIILKYIENWELENKFKEWVLNSCSFHSTLVDRIVPGYPKDEISKYNDKVSYLDNLMVTAERYFLWVIEGGDQLKNALPFDKTGLDVKIIDDMQPYRTRKVRILNGAHTAMVPFSILFGNTTVEDTMRNDFTSAFVKRVIFDEIICTLELSHEELYAFAKDVLDRFRNPFVRHQLSDIALNSISKFKVRVLPSIIEYNRVKGVLPRALTYSMACLIRFYKGAWNKRTMPIKDDESYVNEFKEIWRLEDYSLITERVLANQSFWGRDLNSINNLKDTIAYILEEMDQKGIEASYIDYIQ